MIPPFQFYLSFKYCPHCRARLFTTVPLTRRFSKGPLHRMGFTCYCIQCNSRYRAVSWLHYSSVAWAGPLGRWFWWQSVSLERTLTN